MRDLTLTALIALLLAATLRHPVIGAYLYAWISLMNPHKLTYGFAFNLPFAQLAAITTLFMLLITRQRQALPRSAIIVVQVLFLIWMSVTSLSAYAPADRVLERWMFVMKIHVMLLATWMLVTTAVQIRVLIWVVTLSVALFGIKGGIWTILTGGGGRVWGPPGGMLQGNNELAVGLVILIPMLYFLRQTESRKWLRSFLLLALVFCAFSILGSQSRGALVALVAMTFFLGLKSKYPIRTSLALALLTLLAVAFMPESWTSRMETIKSYDADGSAMSRLWTWKTLWNAVMAHPLTGVGFGADNIAVFSRFAPLDGEWAAFAGRTYVAHSIYFHVLGEHGFVGLGLFLLLGVTVWVVAGRTARAAQEVPEFEPWMPLLMRMVQVSLIGFGAGGAFLSVAYLDLPYYIMGFVVLSQRLVNRSAAERAREGAPDLQHAAAGGRAHGAAAR